MTASTWWCEYAWLPEGPVAGVRIASDDDGSIISVHAGALRHDRDRILHGLVLPGFANTHCHAFHRALRGRTHESKGTFWTWRERMYALADRLDPDTYCDLATAVYSEMVLAGITCVGEFHYLHHGPGGARYGDPNAMGEALREAARRAGLRMTLLDTCYFTAGIGVPLEGVQRRFDDGDAEGWALRVSALQDDEAFRVGAAIHSVRAVPADQLEDVVDACRPDSPDLDDDGRRPLHVHISEFQAENAACLTAYGMTPTRLLAEHGVLGPATTAVHTTHVTPEDVELLGATGTTACICPTTARDLGTGIGPARRLSHAGSPLTVGSDQHAVIDLLEEVRTLETMERLATHSRGCFDVAELVAAFTVDGHAALGWPEAGRLAPGAPADLVAVRLDSVRTAGSLPEQAVMTAQASDIDTVIISGREVVSQGMHHTFGPVGPRLTEAIEHAWRGGAGRRGAVRSRD